MQAVTLTVPPHLVHVSSGFTAARWACHYDLSESHSAWRDDAFD
ncbi:MAG: hypothetical protein OEQ39_11330 [Gammaproteobacteria bacterium]|nr:hypothetical protein [Gammaproteobacteria bacterium]MDH3466288.1 hypothetical protein [Gammaproteobacteria bacterium]